MLSNSLELYRLLQVFPLLMVSATLGFRLLLPAGFKGRSLIVAVLLLAGFFLWDSYNFIGHYADIRSAPLGQQWREVEYFNAYNKLKNLAVTDGPIYLFSDFSTDYDNKTLEVACYPFDALQNPRCSSAHPSWIAFLNHLDYQP